MNQLFAFAVTNPAVILVPVASFLVGTALVRAKARRIAGKIAASPFAVQARTEAELHAAVIDDANLLWGYSPDHGREDARFALSLECAFIAARAQVVLAQLKTAGNRVQRRSTARHLAFLGYRWRTVENALMEFDSALPDHVGAASFNARGQLRPLYRAIEEQARASIRGMPFDRDKIERDFREFSQILGDLGERLGTDSDGVRYSFSPQSIEASRAEWRPDDRQADARAAASRVGP